MAFFLPLRLGEQKIPSLAPVKGDRRSSPEGTRSGAECPCTGIASEELEKI